MNLVETAFDVPIILIVFNRPDTSQKVFNILKEVRPKQLIVISDGPRDYKLGEKEKCAQVRSIVESIDWECNLLRNYSEINLGCAKRVSSGLNWAFSKVDRAIILEDDCIPDLSFFRFCKELLSTYEEDKDIMSIRGTNFLKKSRKKSSSYNFTNFHDCWGWATWARAWQYFDYEMTNWPVLRDSNFLERKLIQGRSVNYWSQLFQATYNNEINSWFYRWLFSCWVKDGLCVLPAVNLVSNIGFRLDATNTISNSNSPYGNQELFTLDFPLRHPNNREVVTSDDLRIQEARFSPRLLTKIRRKLNLA